MDLAETMGTIRVIMALFLLGSVAVIASAIGCVIILVKIRAEAERLSLAVAALSRPSPRPRRPEHL